MFGKQKRPACEALTRFLLVWSCAFLLAASFIGCKNLTTNTALPDVPSESITQKIFVVDSSRSNFSGLKRSEDVRSFYSANAFAPLWFRRDSLTIEADSLLAFVKDAPYVGLSRKDYHHEELRHLMQSLDEPAAKQRVELLLTDAFLLLAHDLRHGVLTSFDTADYPILQAVADHGNAVSALKKLQPSSEDYILASRFLRQLIDCADSLTRISLLEECCMDSSKESLQFKKVALNMHRWRRDRAQPGRCIIVNIPAFELELFDHDTIVLRSRVIVGTPADRTPELSSVIRAFTIFPHWTVPRRIATRELLPQIQKDSTYLAKHRYEVLDANGIRVDPAGIDFNSLNRHNFPYVLRQDVGEGNALGLIKFSFSNPYSVYLHDTNARYLFRKDKRAISHGCVRVEKALDIGRYLLADNDVVTPEDLDQYLELGRQRVITVKNPIPIYVRYYTVGSENGELKFYDDVYGIDADQLESEIIV